MERAEYFGTRQPDDKTDSVRLIGEEFDCMQKYDSTTNYLEFHDYMHRLHCYKSRALEFFQGTACKGSTPRESQNSPYRWRTGTWRTAAHARSVITCSKISGPYCTQLDVQPTTLPGHSLGHMMGWDGSIVSNAAISDAPANTQSWLAALHRVSLIQDNAVKTLQQSLTLAGGQVRTHSG